MHGQDRFLLAGVMGWPISHSRSPKIHNYWLARYGLDGVYVPLAIEPERLAAALRALPALNFSGCNLTIPHKEAALAIVDDLDPTAKRVGAVNCVVVEEDGTLVGRNYDGFGFTASLRAAAPMWRADAGPAAVIGAGGAARAVIAGLIDAGATEVRVFNRTLERAETLARDFGPPVVAHRWEAREAGLADAALLVNTTSQGMVGQPPLDLRLDALPAGALVSDIVYAPLETPLLAAARARGLVAVDGLGMLIHQARPAFRDWFGIMPEATPELRAMIEATL
ncbi:shikimate dehydrogenase [Methylosinus trichosporium]|uniref:Shikimate dehydrogenase (NADP(+)) n=1 Tax=Methylosinus trichosporium (strain ATCC 35070 / NCIMB 11131 / UNIQEM 75 / OB3b) TaxID=595536 RepID=A0A2D2CXV0_METT3|nr:shikimate dehydrogenase [Methylosinus trichosporium]ATQ67567.1 shikimate dehydrogenase [Methylosinus trichosporium OB3b]